MSEPIQTTDEVTEQTEPVTQPENTEEVVAPEAATSDDVLDTPTGEDSQTEDTSPESQQPTDPYKDKFVNSQREAILLAEREKIANARIEQLTKQDTPTDEAMRQLYPEWDGLDEYNKRVLVRTETLAMQQARTLAKQQEIEERQKLDDELDSVVDTNPKLKDKEAEFKRFARNKKNRGIAADVLAKAFLFDASDDEPVTTPVSKADGLPTGSGGPRESLTPKKMSIDDAKNLRETDYKQYVRLIKAGAIEEDI